MRTTTLMAMAALMCIVMAASADVAPMQDFSLEKMAGKWYNVGLACNAQWFVDNKEATKVGTVTFTPTVDGDMDMSYSSLKDDGSCWKVTDLAKKTDAPGRFTFHSQVWSNDNDLRIVDAVFDNYALAYILKTKEGVSEVLVSLYSRGTEVAEDVQQKFTQFSQSNGVLPENIVILPKNAECPEVATTPAP